MTERAVAARMRRSAIGGHIADQPSSSHSFRRGNTVTLANVNGRMARYKVRRHKKTKAEYIRFVD